MDIDDCFLPVKPAPISKSLPGLGPMFASERVAKLAGLVGLGGDIAAVNISLVQTLIFDANGARRGREPEYRLYLRECVGKSEGNLITLF